MGLRSLNCLRSLKVSHVEIACRHVGSDPSAGGAAGAARRLALALALLRPPAMGKGNSVKGGRSGGAPPKAAKRSSAGGGDGARKAKKRRRGGKPEKAGPRARPSSVAAHLTTKRGGKKGKGKGKGKAAPAAAAAEDEGSDVDESYGEGLEEYSGYSSFLLNMDATKLEAPKRKPTEKERRLARKRKAAEREGAAPELGGGEDEQAQEQDEDEEQREMEEYERAPRQQSKWEQKKPEALPVRGADGKWRVPEAPQPAEEDEDDEEENDELEEEMDDEAAEAAAAEAERQIKRSRQVDRRPQTQGLSAWQQKQQGIREAQVIIGKTCAAIVENPEESGHRILRLHELYPGEESDGDSTQLLDCTMVKKMILLSQLAVFKDIAPGYKVRQLSEEEAGAKVSAEVEVQREYEFMLLAQYQKYLQRLHTVAAALNKAQVGGGALALGLVAVQCLAELLTTLSHFNYASNIVSTLIPMIDARQPRAAALARSAVEGLLTRSTYSAAAVTAVRAIDAYAQKRRYRMDCGMLRCLLSLRLTEDADERLRKLIQEKKKARKEQARQGKQLTDAELERDMAEGNAVMDTQARRLAQAAMLRAMFLSFFRVLKSPRRLGPGVLRTALEGLAHFGHLISIDFLGDLFRCINGLLRHGGVLPATVEEELPPPPALGEEDEGEDEGTEDFRLDTAEALTACHTALVLLSGERGETLEVDPQTVSTALYFLLPRVAGSGEYDALVPVALEALRLALLQRRQLSAPRVGAFFKAVVGAAAGAVSAHTALALIAFARQLLMRYPLARRLLDSVDEGQQTAGGVVGLGLGPRGFRPDVEPDHANALECTAWELSCLARHWHPAVRDAVRHTREFCNNLPLKMWPGFLFGRHKACWPSTAGRGDRLRCCRVRRARAAWRCSGRHTTPPMAKALCRPAHPRPVANQPASPLALENGMRGTRLERWRQRRGSRGEAAACAGVRMAAVWRRRGCCEAIGVQSLRQSCCVPRPEPT